MLMRQYADDSVASPAQWREVPAAAIIVMTIPVTENMVTCP